MTVRVPLASLSHIFYICELRSGQCRDLSIISQWRKMKMPLDLCVRIGTVQIFWNDNVLELMTEVRFLGNNLLEGHPRSLKATVFFLSVSLH